MSKPLEWYDDNATNPPWIKALAVRRLAPREGWCYHHVQAIIVSIALYAEAALGNREYFLNKPYGIGGGRNDHHPVTTNTTRRRSGAKSPGRANIPERNIPQPLMKLPDFKGHLRSPQDSRHRRALAGHYFPFAFSRRVKDRFSKSALTITDFTDRLSNFAM